MNPDHERAHISLPVRCHVSYKLHSTQARSGGYRMQEYFLHLGCHCPGKTEYSVFWGECMQRKQLKRQ